MSEKSARTWKIIAIVFMGFTAAMNILGGAGTVCAAFLTKQYPPMWVFLDYQWLYQPLMILTILTGIFCVRSTTTLIRGGKNVYRTALIVLVIGTILAGTQYFASMAIRGKGVPSNIKFYINLATLVLFLVLGLPKLKEYIDFTKPARKVDKTMAGGLAAFISGIAVLTVFIWAGPSHTYQGVNWVEVYTVPILVSGLLLTFGGFMATVWGFLKMYEETKIEISSSAIK